MDETIGAAISLRRRALGLTQARLARLAGLDQPAISRLEAGARTPALPVLERIARVLGLRVTIGLEPLTPNGAPNNRPDTGLDAGPGDRSG